MIALGRGEIDFSSIITAWEVNLYELVIQRYWNLYGGLHLKKYSDLNYYELLQDCHGRKILIDFFTDMKNSFPKE